MRAGSSLQSGSCCQGRNTSTQFGVWYRFREKPCIARATRKKQAKGKGFGTAAREEPSSDPSTRPCSCGSRRRYEVCCQPFHNGQWAPTAVDLARARHAAIRMGLCEYVADTTYSESPELVGGRGRYIRSLTSRAPRSLDQVHVELCRKLDFKLIDLHHGPGEEEDVWYVILWINSLPIESFTMDSAPSQEERFNMLFCEQYQREGGRWWFVKRMEDCPHVPGLDDFAKRYEEYEAEGTAPSDFSMREPRVTNGGRQWALDLSGNKEYVQL